MRIPAKALIVLVAIEHVGFLVLEMFFLDKPPGIETFHNTTEAAKSSVALAGNHGSIAAFSPPACYGRCGKAGATRKISFLACVIVAGLYGAETAMASILFVQALPALLALLAVLASQVKDA